MDACKIQNSEKLQTLSIFLLVLTLQEYIFVQ